VGPRRGMSSPCRPGGSNLRVMERIFLIKNPNLNEINLLQNCVQILSLSGAVLSYEIESTSGKSKNILRRAPTCDHHVQYSSAWAHAGMCTIRWRGADSTPLTAELMVACQSTAPLTNNQWHKIGGLVDPRQQRQNSCATNGLLCPSVWHWIHVANLED
jgi:hypothetical protein